MYFMATESKATELISDFLFDELNDAFNDLNERYSNICKLNKTYKKQINYLENDISTYIESKIFCVSNIEPLMHDIDVLNARCNELLSQNACHIDDISTLNEKIIDQNAIICKCTSGRDNLNMLLCNPNISYHKSRLGYDTYIVSSSHTSIPVRKNNVLKIKKLWIPKVSTSNYNIVYLIANKYGPKKGWVQKEILNMINAGKSTIVVVEGI